MPKLPRIRGPWAAIIVGAALGCSDAPPAFDPLVNYTPESLAAELSLRYAALSPAARDAAPTPAKRPRGPVEAGKKEATKEAATETLATVLDDINAKAAAIPGMTPAAARAAVADRVAADPAIASGHKQRIVAALRETPAP